MTPIVVNGQALPAELADMLATGRWGPSCRPGDLSALPIADKDDLGLLDLSQIIANTRELHSAVERGEGVLLGLTWDRVAETGWLAVDQAVMIAATYGQEALALDYSQPGGPRVVSTHEAGGQVRWVEVAPSFGDLVALIRLPEDPA